MIEKGLLREVMEGKMDVKRPRGKKMAGNIGGVI